ncbi:MAG: hypothetical protein RLY20_2038 [Verrucomicrobiota bacterium]
MSKIVIKIKKVALGCALVALFIFSASAQQPQQPNPAAIMLSPQPSIDTTTPVEATASFDPPIIRAGDVATYRISFNALIDSIQWPEDVIAPPQLNLRPSARGQSMAQTGAMMQPRAGFNYRVTVTNTGSFTVPRFIVYVYDKPVTVPAATLQVVGENLPPVLPRKHLLLDVPNKNPFVGQLVNVRIVEPGAPSGITILNSLKLNGDGFLPGQFMGQQMRIFPEYNSNYASVVCESSLTPLKPGKLDVSAQAFTGNLQSAFLGGGITIQGTISLPGGPQPQILLDSEPVTLDVRPLPRERELPGYTGGIGHFKLDPPQLAVNALRVGEPVTLSVRVRGDGNLLRLTPPKPPTVPGWQVFAGPVDAMPPQLIQAQGFTTFSWTLIPTSETNKVTPRIPFSFFDPDKGDYVDASVPSVPVKVSPGAAPVDVAAFASTNATATGTEREPKLSGLAAQPGKSMATLLPVQRAPWFPVVQVAPAVLFAALWAWDRRRRFHEAHPEVMLRRRARRALRREWAAVRKAAALGDTSRFAACAVNAMRAACAPHYPAEPRALVSSDVVPLLDGADATNATQAVRRIFAAADAERFAGQPPGATDVLALRGELDRVLAQLEAKL